MAKIIACVMFGLCFLSGLSSMTVVETKSNSSDATPSPPPVLVVDIKSNIGKPGALLFSLDVEGVIFINFTLRCASLDTVYTLTATTSTHNVARIVQGHVFNISCQSAVPIDTHNTTDNSQLLGISENKNTKNESTVNYIGLVTGETNMTISTSNIGRSFLFITAEIISGPELASQNELLPAMLNSPFTGARPTNLSNNVGVSLDRPEGVQHRAPNVVGRAMVIVMQLPRIIDNVFRIVLYVVIIMATIGMGVSVELPVIKAVLMRPVAPLIGLACQYIGMPLIAYAVAKTVPQENAAISLGIFTCGIAPGGGMSNMFTYLFGGDLALSVAMTTISNIAALAFIPLWIFTLGSTFSDETTSLHVPYLKILETLALVILPIFAGIFIEYKFPKIGKWIKRCLKPVLMLVVTFMLALGIYTNIFIFKMIKPMTIAAGCLLPYVGYLVGGVVAFVLCQSWCRIKTIAIETGIQNSGIAFLIVYLSLPPPDNQLAAVGPASSAIMTPLPLFLLVIIYTIYNRCQRKSQPKNDQDEKLTKLLENGAEQTVVVTTNGEVEKPKQAEKEKEKKKKKSMEEKQREMTMRQLQQGDQPAAILVLWRKLHKKCDEKTMRSNSATHV